jgi:hypothetical protein
MTPRCLGNIRGPLSDYDNKHLYKEKYMSSIVFQIELVVSRKKCIVVALAKRYEHSEIQQPDLGTLIVYRVIMYCYTDARLSLSALRSDMGIVLILTKCHDLSSYYSNFSEAVVNSSHILCSASSLARLLP